MIRENSPRTNLADLEAEIVTGDLLDRESLDRAMTGVRSVCHVAADYRIWAADPEEIVRNNLDGTRNVMEAALEGGIERLVYTSSVATLRPYPTGPADESRAATPEQAVGAYKRSKVIAERLVEKTISDNGLQATIVMPSTPIGPRDVRPTPTGRIVVEAASGRMPAFVESGLNLVHVDDVAEGHVLALQKGRIGEKYILGGQDVSLREMLGVIARLVGRRAPTVQIPRGPLFPLAWTNEKFARATGREPFLTLDGLRMAAHNMYFTSAKAEAELGYRARPYEEALVDAIAWFRQAGMIK
ncbi:MAG: NAD-dependent epimerase/dehydratase family protein [Sphingomonadales bacterium]|nr:NAD-dependent epimerase/dehydratase family protein [Sphingomonadales bacterium]